MINPRLFDIHGIDTGKDLGIDKICARPFDTLLIDKEGSCYACECTAWLPQSIGNLRVRSLTEILNSAMRKHIQLSVSDGSYRYCNDNQCAYIKSGSLPGKKSEHIKNLRLGIDESCNLRCPSCRNGLIFHKSGPKFKLGIELADKITRWLDDSSQPVKVHIGSDGDPFASQVYRHFMQQAPERDSIKYSILTNGLMFVDFHQRIPHVIRNLNELAVSIDGATEHTYERLRLGGRWDKVNEALRCMSALKHEHGFKLSLHMVVQQDNWREMGDMLSMGDRYGVDMVYFNKIQDWQTNLDYRGQIFTSQPEFIDLLQEVVKHPKAHNNVISV